MEYLHEILDALADRERFIRLTLSGPAAPTKAKWQKIVLKPVLVSSGWNIQAVLQGRRKQVSRNIAPQEMDASLREFLEMGFRRINLQCADGDLHVRISKKGRALVSRGKPSLTTVPSKPAHDREKQYPLPANQPDEFLEKLGVMRDGRVIAAMRDKFRQINQFLEILSSTKLVQNPPADEMRIVDCGCGRAFLMFAAYHYLHGKLGMRVSLTGVDADEEVIASAVRLRDQIGYANLELVRTRISDYEPALSPNIGLSLHACDTATDEAIARGVRWKSPLILCVPCCQHELHHKISKPAFRATLRHGILRERMSDILTDALRAAALRVMGYKAEVIEFVSPGHTAKNLMIRAERRRGLHTREAAREYLALRDEWQVIPCIERMLGEKLFERLKRASP